MYKPYLLCSGVVNFFFLPSKYCILLIGVFMLLVIILNKLYYVESSNIIVGLVTKTVVHFYTDFTSWLLKQIMLSVLCIVLPISIPIWILKFCKGPRNGNKWHDMKPSTTNTDPYCEDNTGIIISHLGIGHIQNYEWRLYCHSEL